MFKQAAIMAVLLGLAATAAAQDGALLVQFDGAVGVQPVANVAGPVNADQTFPNVKLNIVRGINPAGPWRIAGLEASVFADGRIFVRGRGLLLAAGNSIGQTAGQRVFATLICEAALPFDPRSTAPEGVALDPNGDFQIDDMLDSVPSECSSPVLLIRASSNGTWFAAGLPKLVKEDQ
jgi:hypothetical protein